jgi:hypothetical protein
MNYHDIKEISKIKGEPCVTITLFTHRTAPRNQQDKIRLENLVKQAEIQLLEKYDKNQAAPVIERLKNLARDIDYQNTLDGLVVFVNASFARTFYLPFNIGERVVVQDSFHTRDLVFAMNRTPRYWVLVLSEKPTRLFEVSRKEFIEVDEGEFPMTHEGPGGEQALPGGFGIKRSGYRDEYHRKFFRSVDNALRPFLLDDPLPLVVVGVDRFLAFFNKMTQHQDWIIASLKGSHDSSSVHELGELVWPLVKVALDEKRQQVFAELEQAISDRKYASSVGEVWRMANDGRGRLLIVEEDFHYPAKIDEKTGQLVPAEDPTAPGVITDVVDEIIETVLRKDGKVVFVDKGKLQNHRGIALILRY